MDSVALKDELTCSICKNIFGDPVTLRCGHNFCRDCIEHLLSEQDSTRIYKCPDCNKIFSERPSPQTNLTLSSIAERFMSTKQEEKEEVVILCNYCIHSSVAAVKSCLLCEASLCEDHLRVHSKSPEHVLSNPTASPEITKCSIHNEILKYYCSEDNDCICVSCSLVGKHKGHQVDLLPDAADRMKGQLKDIQETLTRLKDQAEDQLQNLQDRKVKLSETAAEIKKRHTDVIRNIRIQLDLLEIQVSSEISEQEEKASLLLADLIQKLEKERDDLSTTIEDIIEICNMTDPLTVLQEGASFFDEEDSENQKMKDTNVNSVGKLDEGLISEMLHTKITDILTTINDDLRCYEATGLSLDPNTASNNVSLSGDFKSASRTENSQNLYEHPGRFTTHSQVLSTITFSSGLQYWEVETNGSDYWMLGMCYPSIERNGPMSWVGASRKSWVLKREYGRYSARRMFEGEMASLEAILRTDTVRVPRPEKVIDLPAGGAVLVMEHLNMRSLNRQSAVLGEQLADLHLHNQRLRDKLDRESGIVGKGPGRSEVEYVDRFGFHAVTCCGYLPLVNDWQEDWVTFYARQRIQVQIDMLEKSSGDREARELWAQLQLKVPQLFSEVEVVPSLLHGDLWGGNVAELDTGPVIFDPASFYGHSEFELAIAGMFGGFSSSFYSAYYSKIPKAPGADKRLKLYQLFHYLNHWNHFGGGYRGSSLGIMRSLLK